MPSSSTGSKGSSLSSSYAKMGLWQKINDYNNNLMLSNSEEIMVEGEITDSLHSITKNVSKKNNKKDSVSTSFKDLYREIMTSAFADEISSLREGGGIENENDISILIESIESGTLLFNGKQKSMLIK